MSAHWGTIPYAGDTTPVPIDRDVLLKAKNMEIEGPDLHQPSSRHYPPVNESYNPEAFQLDSLVLHTIRLIQHARRLRSLLHSANVQLQELKNGESSEMPLNFTPAPAIPEYTGRELNYKERDSGQALPFLHPIDEDKKSDFMLGKWTSPPEIDHRTNRRLLRKSVAAISAHTGFDNCGESVLETLTDISHEYMLQMTRLLRRAVDNKCTSGQSGFPDSIEQVFYEMGLGSMTNLHDFYQNRVIRYHDNMLQTCKQLTSEYEKLTSPETKLHDELIKSVKLKDEPPSDINFPSMDESEDGGTDNEVIQLDNLGLDSIGVTQESGGSISQEEDSKWPQSTKSETNERLSTNDGFDGSTGAVMPGTGEDSSTSEVTNLSDPEHLLSPHRPPKKKKKK